MAQGIWPEEIRLADERRTLRVTFDDGSTFDLSAEFLRVNSPSAEVQGHSPDQRITVAGKQNITINDLEPVGNYAIKIVFADGHDTGIFSWSTLSDMGQQRDRIWADYLRNLEQKGFSREPGL
jgi:DUF971 family protein